MKLLIFTDLDGSLMEHESYSLTPALPALDALAARDFPVIMCSSKTRAEILDLQASLNWSSPYICENGAALYPNAAVTETEPSIAFGAARDDWLPRVHGLRDQFHLNFSGFADWSAAEIRDRTGLPVAQAELAAQRQFSEPIEWRDTVGAMRLFVEELSALNLRLLEGGRFFSIQGSYDKGDALTWMRDRGSLSDDTLIVALGDSPNDEAMLEHADVAVVIKSAKSNQIHLRSPRRVIRTTRPGPAGWHDAMMEILSLLDANALMPETGD